MDRRLGRTDDIVPLLALLGAGGALEWFDCVRPTALGVWGPYGFSWPIFLALSLPVILYWRGMSREPSRRQSAARRALFLTGSALIFIVLQSHFAFLAQHMFTATRLQHLAIHHLGPFLIALAWPFDAMAAGLPRSLRAGPATRATLAFLQRPAIAGFLFVGLIYLWLIPPVQFRAMLNPGLYALMNWSMTLDGLLFWTLILDPRPAARPGIPGRIVLAIAVQMPQVLLGGMIANIDRDLYPAYNLCGRIFPGIGPLLDQQIGGFILWYPAAMMSAVAVFILLRRLGEAETRGSTPAPR